MRLATILMSCMALYAACRPLNDTRIKGSDLAHLSAFQNIPPDAFVAYAALPGMVRTLAVPELRRLARRYGAVAVPEEAICFEIPTAPLDEAVVLAAMKSELPPHTNVDLVELSRHPVPIGRVSFRNSALPTSFSAPPETALLWRGRVQYTREASVAIWAKVKLSRTVTLAVAARDLGRGHELSPSDVEYRTTKIGAFGDAKIPAADQLAGNRLRRALKRGAAITMGNLVSSPLVDRGEAVRVRVESAGTTLHFGATALAPGRHGETVPLQNPATRRTFRARVDGRGSAVLNIP